MFAKIFRKKDGNLMLYINGDNKCSIGVSDSGLCKKYGKYSTTKGQNNLVDKVFETLPAILENASIFSGDLSTHKEVYDLGNLGKLAITDIANIGGHATGSDGAFIIVSGKIFNIDKFTKYKNL